MRTLHILAIAVHGALVALHGIGAGYNILRRNWTDVAIHAGGVLYSSRAVALHAQDLGAP